MAWQVHADRPSDIQTAYLRKLILAWSHDWADICSEMGRIGVPQFIRENGWGNREFQVNRLLKALVKEGLILVDDRLPHFKVLALAAPTTEAAP